MSVEKFQGFPKESLRFLKALKRNNDREWFEAHRDHYENFILKPSRLFIESLREPLKEINPHILVSPKSMFRIYRDTRFSSDKTPYKTWVGYTFRDQRGDKDKGSAPMFYMGWDPTGLAFAGGIYQFTPLQRSLFRSRVTEGDTARSFTQVVKKIHSGKHFEVKGKDLKRMPQGYDPDHPNAPFLLHNGAYAFYEEDFPASFGKPQFTQHVLKRFKECSPMVQWTAQLNRPSFL